jgi:hypothetical protein
MAVPREQSINKLPRQRTRDVTTELLGTVFSIGSVPRLVENVRTQLQPWFWCETVVRAQADTVGIRNLATACGDTLRKLSVCCSEL